ncbi:dienelactone hydrolase family protein [Peredibacter starrii]|uniref:Dienelactone hydrolase family protein n=1 Tax=Peredibacter starrii TaxID=28202 RepID=A0AAX4HNM6_9BACT|nr:dienelactone hydrolase family protein [Peredibacter starrii]WPU64841.1 dienelactone hydrolase family protein [Peredibacter starrii]
MNISKNFLTIETPTGPFDLYVASPETNSPVVLVFMEAFGVNHHIQNVCERLAQEGFMAVAPDLYHREGRRITVDYANREAIFPLLGKLTNEQIIEDIHGTLRFLEDLPTADLSQVYSIGFCVGGFMSALGATKIGIKRMISFYGGGMVRPREGFHIHPFLDELKNIRGQTLFFFGGKDASIPESDINVIRQTLSKDNVPHEIVVYEQGDHGFFCEERKVYNAEAAADAWKRTLEFFK